MGLLRSITVYCSSSREVDKVYFDAATELGRRIAEERWRLVYGGNDIGCMGALAQAARDAGGRVIGITPQLLANHGLADKRCDELIVTPTIRERKALMEARGDAFITLPGGLGTLEEIFEIVVGRTLGAHNKPIVLLNVAGFYQPLLAMIEHGIDQKFIKPKARNFLKVSDTAEGAIGHLKQVWTAANSNHNSKPAKAASAPATA